MHVIAAKAVSFKEALEPEFKLYAKRVIENARALADRLIENGLAVVSGGTDSHLMLIDLRRKGDMVTGKALDHSLGRAHITANFNGVPFDPRPPSVRRACASARRPRPARCRSSSSMATRTRSWHRSTPTS